MTSDNSGAPSTEGVDLTVEGRQLCRRNVRLMYAFQLVNAFAMGIAMGPVFDNYLYYLSDGAARGPQVVPLHRKKENTLVGLAESISGISSLILAVPVGLAVDRNQSKRARLLVFCGVFAIPTLVVGTAAIYFDYLILIFVFLAILGLFSTLSSSASEAIFADSIPRGQRSKQFTVKAILTTVGAAGGPAVSAVLLWIIGDEWEAYQMKVVILAGISLIPISGIILFFFKDPPAILLQQHPSDSINDSNETSARTVRRSIEQRRCGPYRSWQIPIIISISDFITCIGAGMTIKFFNLFFIKDQKFSPIQINLLQTVYPLGIALFMKFSQQSSTCLGRAQASLLFFSCNVLCFVFIAELHNLVLLIMLYLLRGAFANSTYPIDRSILMDFTPSSQRGRWNAVESFTSMTWSGSAFIGGLLSDKHDYRFTFLITGSVYAVGCLNYLPLLCLVPRKEASMANGLDSETEHQTSLMDQNQVESIAVKP